MIVSRVRHARREANDKRRAMMAGTRVPSVQERQAELVQFYDRYEELVGSLCDGAQYGPTPKLERIYASERDWMRQNYPSIRPFVISFLTWEIEDAEIGKRMQGRETDAFEALSAGETLDELLRADDGCMISRITRTREALTLYGEHLRQLAARLP